MERAEILSPFTYELPKDRIAQRPCHPADHAKLLVVDRESGEILDRRFYDLPNFLKGSDRLVFNDTRVIPARLFGVLNSVGGASVELLLIERITDSRWVCIGRPLKKVRAIGSVRLSESLSAEVVPGGPELDRVTVEFKSAGSEHISLALAKHGSMPIPPYIRGGKGDELDEIDYQSIFAKHPGSVAAPTASLHFNEELLSRIKQSVACPISHITLHVGTASFLPVIEDGEIRPPGSERLHVSEEVLREIEGTKQSNGRVIGVGTTVVRALEGAINGEEADSTDLFITPGFSFKRVDAVVTNFHQPGTTHLLLVEALLGRELLKRVYDHALARDYRFLSYGDGMFIV